MEYLKMPIQNAIKTDPPCSYRIYVACLASYNAGTLHGKWIDLDYKSLEEVEDEIQVMLKQSKEPFAEEYAIHDYEGICCEEYESIRLIVDKVEVLCSLEENEKESYLAFCNNLSTLDSNEHPQNLLDKYRDCFYGHYDREIDFAEELFDEHAIPEHVLPYIDHEKYSLMLFMTDFYSLEAPDHGVYVFINY